jgi:hypothetical protein
MPRTSSGITFASHEVIAPLGVTTQDAQHKAPIRDAPRGNNRSAMIATHSNSFFSFSFRNVSAFEWNLLGKKIKNKKEMHEYQEDRNARDNFELRSRCTI